MSHDKVSDDTDHRRQVDAVLVQALEFDSFDDRAAFVRSSCGSNTRVREEVLKLLASDDASKAAMDRVFSQRDEAISRVVNEDGRNAGELIGSCIGNFRITEHIATGGMGAVYRAERADGQFSQEVAIKILPHWATDQSTIARLRVERQILSSLQHPCITQLMTGGETADGFPYLVTQFIDGQPITRYVASNKLSTRSILRLFCKLADAVHYAHTKLIVHRDIKPSNILVDEGGHPHLLDFGIAKILDPAQADVTMHHTIHGRSPMTLQYASPEQRTNSEVTTASDIYQLGLLLQELLTGERKQSNVTALRGDLQTIVHKALREEPEARYASAAEFASDIRRYLDGDAIVARRESALDLARRLARKNPFGAFAVAAIFALILVWAVSVQVYSSRLEAERDYAAQQAARAARVKHVLTNIYRRHDPLEADAIGDKSASLWDSLDMAVRDVSAELARDPDFAAELYTIFGSLYAGAGRVDDAIRVMREAEANYESMGDMFLAELAVTRADLAGLLMNTEKPESQHLLESAVSLLPRIENSHPSEALSVLQEAAFISHESGNRHEAIRFLEEAQRIYDEHGLNDASRRIEILTGMGRVLVAEDRLAEAAPTLEEALALSEALFGSDHARLAGVLDALSSLERNRGNLDAAVAYSNRVVTIMRRSRAENYEDMLQARNNLALALAKSGDLNSAIDILKEVVELRRGGSVDGGGNMLGLSLKNLASIQHMAGDYVGAMQSVTEAQELIEAHLPPDSAYQATPHFTKSLIYLDTGRAVEAELSARHSLDLLLPVLGDRHYQVYVNRCVIGESLIAQGKPEQARPLVLPAMRDLLAAETRVPRYERRCAVAVSQLDN